MFWRDDSRYWYHYHRRRSFRRGMTAMFLLVIVVYAVLHYYGSANSTHPGHAARRHHLAKPHPARSARLHSRTAAAHPSPAHQHHQHEHRAIDHPRNPAKPITGTWPARAREQVADAGQSLSWTGYHGIDLPAARQAGPRDTRDGLASGFADTPRGALVAAINIAVRTAPEWGPAVYGPTITRQVTGPAAGALLAADNRAWTQFQAAARARVGIPVPPGASEQAYRFTAWTPSAASIDLITAGPASNGTQILAMTRLRLLWQHGDWRLEAPPGGSWARTSTAITSLAGYTILPAER